MLSPPFRKSTNTPVYVCIITHTSLVNVQFKYYFNALILIDNSRINPVTKEVFVGEAVSFVCDSQGSPKWFSVNMLTNTLSDIPLNAHVKSNNLYIQYAELTNGGIYECQGQLNEYYEDSQEKVKFAARAVLVVGMRQN